MMFDKTKLAALALCLAGLVCALTGAACTTSGDSTGGSSAEEVVWEFDATLPVACEEGDNVSIGLNVEGVTDYEVAYEVTAGGEKITVDQNGNFIPAAAGTYTVKITVTANGETKDKTYTLTVIKDATAPVITTPIADKTAQKGDYDFAADLASIVATDNKSQAENLKKSIVSVTLDGVALTVTENVCTLERAGEYNVVYKVEDEEGNSVNGSYTITVSGLYLNEKTFVSQIFQLEGYVIAGANAYGYEDASIVVTLTQDEKTTAVNAGDTVKFVSASPVTVKYALTVNGEEKEVIEKTVEVTALDMLLSKNELSATEGDEIEIPSATLSHETEGVSITVKVTGQYQEEKAVVMGEKLAVASGVTRIVYTAENAEKTFKLEREAAVVATGKDEIVSFEKNDGTNPDFDVPAWGDRIKNEELNSDPKYVKAGRYSAKLIFGENRPNKDAYNAGFLYWSNQIKTADVSDANGLSMWIYSEKHAYIIACIATGGGTLGEYSGAKASHVIELNEGWNDVCINFKWQIYNPGTVFDIKSGISELFFYNTYANADDILRANGGNNSDPNVINTDNLVIYLDQVRMRKLDLPEGVYFTMDTLPESTGTMGGTATAVAPRMLDDSATLTITVTAPNGEQKTVKAGDTFDLDLGGYYTITYKAEKEGKKSQEESYQVLVSVPGEFLSFETINGSVPDLTKAAFGTVTANTDLNFVKSGKQSAKLETVLNTWGNCVAGFAWDGSALQMPTIDNANGITFWMYSEKDLYLYTTLTTGVGATWKSVSVKPVALTAGWNYVTIDMRYSLTATGADLNNGIQELYFRTGDANGAGKTPATLYIDSVCFANLELPDGVYFVFDEKPVTAGTMGGTATAVAPRMLDDTATLTVTVTAPNGLDKTIKAGDTFDLELGGYYTITYKAEKEGKKSQEESYQILVSVPGEFMSFEDINGSVPEIANGVYGTVIANTDAAYVKSGKQSAKLVFGSGNTPVGTHQAGFVDWSAKYKPDIQGANGIAFWMHSDINAYLYANISTGSGSAYSGAKTSKAIELKTGWNYVEINMNSDMVSSGVKIADGIAELFFRLGSDANGADHSGNIIATLYLDSVCFAKLEENGEFMSFETINGSVPDIEKAAFGTVTLNTDAAYVKSGKQSAKLETVLNEWGNCVAGFAWNGSALQMPTIENANAITFWMYSEKALYLYATLSTGVGDTWKSSAVNPIALEEGWNFVTINMNSSLQSTGPDLNNGIQELFFKTGDASGAGTTPVTLYIDNVCFAKVA